jgi:hypothetical protein
MIVFSCKSGWFTGDASTERQATKPAVILDGRVNAQKAQRKIIVGEGRAFGYITCGANHARWMTGEGQDMI